MTSLSAPSAYKETEHEIFDDRRHNRASSPRCLPSTAALADPVGEWRVADRRPRFASNIAARDLCGFIASTSTAPGKDEKNPDPAKRSRSVLGMEVLINMKPQSKNLWAGTTYNAEDGLTYTASMWQTDESSLNIKGCAPRRRHVWFGKLDAGAMSTRCEHTGTKTTR